MNVGQAGVKRQQGLAHGGVQGVDRPVAIGGGVHDLIAHPDLDGGFGGHPALLTIADEDVEIEQFKGRLIARLGATDEQFDRSLGPFELKALAFQLFDALQDVARLLTAIRQVQAELVGLVGDIALARKLRDDDAGVIANPFRLDVLVALLALEQGVDVHSPFVGKGAATYIRLLGKGAQVGDLADIVSYLGQGAQLLVADAVLPHFELEGRDDGAQVGVAAALAIAVDGPLDMDNPRFDGHQRVGYRHLAVIVGVDAQGRRRRLLHLDDDGSDGGGQGSAVGIAQHQHVGAGLGGSGQRPQRIVGIGPVAVEKVLGVIDHLPPLRLEIAHAVGDHAQVLLQRRVQHTMHVQVPAFAKDGHGGRAGLDERPDVGIVLHRQAGAAGAAERGDHGLLQVQFGGLFKEGHILGVGTGPAPFDVSNAQPVQAAGDLEFVRHGKGDAFPLRPIAQSGVVQDHRHNHVSFNTPLPARGGPQSAAPALRPFARGGPQSAALAPDCDPARAGGISPLHLFPLAADHSPPPRHTSPRFSPPASASRGGRGVALR